MLGENYKEPSFEYDLVKAVALLNRHIEQKALLNMGLSRKLFMHEIMC